MIRRGHKVTILTAGHWRRGEVHKAIGGRIIVEIPYLPGGASPVFPNFLESFLFNQAALKWLNNYAPLFDLVHLQGQSGFLFPKSNKTGVPVISSIYDLTRLRCDQSVSGQLQPLEKRLMPWVRARYGKSQLTDSDALLAMSRRVKLELRDQFEIMTPTHLIYNGVDIVPDAKSGKPTEPIALYVGPLHSKRSIETLLQAWTRVRKPYRLIMIGEGVDKKQILHRIEGLGLAQRVVITGRLNQPEVQRWMKRAAFLLFPDFCDMQIPTLLEAGVLAKPLIAADLPAVKEFILHNERGWLFERKAPSQLAGAVNLLIEEPEEAKRLGENMRLYVEKHFSWDRSATRVEKVYKETLERPKVVKGARRSSPR